MSRLDIMTPSHAQTVIDGLYRDVERRIAASPPGLCPVDLAKSFLDLCHAQTCGKCVPCRIGLGQLSELMEQVLEGEATMETISIIERVARVIVNSADCAIGRDAARLVLDGVQGFRDDYEEHILRHRCLGGMREPVPCVALCPAGVDIPGYLVLIKYGRYADAVRLIRKDNPFPSACAYICEHPCEARCRRNMIDDAVNIRGLKRYAVDNAGYVPQPDCAEPTGKKVAVIGGGPSGLSAAYYLALMGHKVTVYEKCAKLGGMLRYGIPNYRLPREVLDAEIASMLALGIDVHVNVNVGDDVTFDELRQQNDALYIALGAHTDKKTGIEGEDAGGRHLRGRDAARDRRRSHAGLPQQGHRRHRRRQRRDGCLPQRGSSRRAQSELRLPPPPGGHDGPSRGSGGRRCRGRGARDASGTCPHRDRCERSRRRAVDTAADHRRDG